MADRPAPVAGRLAQWAAGLEPDNDDLALAHRALLDTMAVARAAHDDPINRLLAPLSQAGRWAALAHVLDYDDLHLPSTTHISAVCVPAALSDGGGARAYLAGAGVMARLGTALGWQHYSAGWHATCTAGVPGAAVSAGVARGLTAAQLSVAIALSIASAGGVQRAFGTTAKSLQVAAAVEAGVRAAALAQAGATADLRAVEDWMRLVRGRPESVELDGPAVPGGLATKPYPCCYALQRPIAAARELTPVDPDAVVAITVRTPEPALTPLVHHRPQSGLEGKFSLEYGVAAALLDGEPGIDSFTDAAVNRPVAQRLMDSVRAEPTPGGEDLLTGQLEIELQLDSGEERRSVLELPPGAPRRPLTDAELRAKIGLCVAGDVDDLSGLRWDTAPAAARVLFA